jgi:hypothetical protein
MRTEKPAPPLYHQLDSYLIFAGENLPLARAVMARPWPDAAASDHERYWSAFGRMYLAAYDRRWQEVLNLHAAATRQGLPMDQVEPLVVEAAINVGDVEKACQVARGLLGRYGKEGESGAMGYTTFDYSTALLAVAAAVAAGRDDLARGLLGLAERLDKERFNRLIAQDTHDAWAHLGIVPLVLPFVRSAVTDGEDEFANWVLLRLKTFQRELSLEEWREVFEKHKFGKVNQRYFHWLDAFVLARVGRCAQAKEAARRFADSYSGLEAFHKAMDLVAAHADRLEKDWSELEGTYQLFDGREKGSYWAVRWDGGTLYLDRDGKVRQFPGLAPGQVHVAINGDSIKAFSTGTIYVRGRQVYLFDDQEKRWVPSFASPCRVPAHDDYWDDPTGPLVLKYVMREYPADGPGREMMRRTVGPGAWRLYEFNGDLTLAAHPETLKLVDLSRQIGQRAGKAGPAAVYRLHPQEQAATLLVPTDAGLWRMNQQGELERVDMGLKDPNVIVRLLSWPVRQGKTYVGVAPQQGGQVVEIGDATGQTRLTGGYCGLGPEDSFCWMMHDKRGKRMLACEYAIQRLYEKRLAGQAPAPPGWEPASAPASGAPAPTSGALAGEAPLR